MTNDTKNMRTLLEAAAPLFDDELSENPLIAANDVEAFKEDLSKAIRKIEREIQRTEDSEKAAAMRELVDAHLKPLYDKYVAGGWGGYNGRRFG